MEEALERARAGLATTFEAPAATMKGTMKWWEVSVLPLRDERGRVHRISAVSRDVSTRRAAQEAMAALNATLEERVAERTRQLDAERAATAAFVAYTEAVGTETDLLTLARHAIAALRARFPDGSVGYYTRHGELWRAQAWSEDMGEALVARLRAGLPDDTPFVRPALETREAHFTDGWDPEREHIEHSEDYGSAAAYPVVVDGKVGHLLLLGRKHTPRWSERDRALFRAVGKALALALERAEQTRRLEEERGKLAAANEELEAFAYSVSHDLRAPVRHITSFAEVLRRALGEHPAPRVVQSLGMIEDAAARMNVLIDAMLDLSRLARLPLRRGAVDLDALVGAARAELAPDLRGRRVSWRVSPLPLVQGDAGLLRQVLVNLLGNAVKYTRGRDEAVIEVWAEDRPQEWAVFVRDNGVGFDPRHGGKLFGVFQRLHRAEEFEGVGVGLANVRRLVERHGGRVSATGDPGKGATFGFTLPKRA